MEFRLLGPVEAVRDGAPVALGGPRPRALLALLLVRSNELVTREALIDALWADRAPGTAEHSLDVQISRLRKALHPEEVLETRSGGYVLHVAPEDVDAQRFERLLEEGRRANAAGAHETALTALEGALALWRGDALADLAYEDFAREESDRLEELRLVAREERVDAGLALGRHHTLIPELEQLVAKHPLRERLRGQLMLALYRSGRHAEALRVYADARRKLVEELGIEPSQTLRELERAILRQDPALEPPKRAIATRRGRTLAGAGALALAGAAAAVVVGLTQGGTETAQALSAPDSNVFIAAESGELVRAAPVRDTIRVAFGDGALWSISSKGELTRLDPATGKEVARLGLGVEPAGLAVGEGSVWVTGASSPTLYRIDPSVNKVVDEFPLPMEEVVTDLTGEVAVGAGSVWVGHGAFNPGAWIERLDPETGRVRARRPILAGDVDHLAFGEGALWVASTASGELRKIDPRTNRVAFRRILQPQLCCVAAGGGYVWAASNPDGVLWKVTTDGSVLPTIDLPAAVAGLTYADGALWAALGEQGAVVRIDPTTDELRVYELGHSVTSVDVRDGVIAAGVRYGIADVTGDLSGDVVRIGRKGPELFDSGAPTDPAFTDPTWDGPQEMFHYTTCARLLNHPDAEGEEGVELVPEVAKDLPEVSNGGRTYTFEIRKGFGFSPPSREEVTAESFRHALERKIDLTKLFGDALWPELANIVGAEAYYAGKARHVSGFSARGDELVIRLREPAPDLPWRLATSSCAVPLETPVVPGGIDTPVPSAGPYYLAAHTDSVAVLRPNPNYGGTRPQHLDAIVVEFNVSPPEAATRIEAGTLDYFLESQTPTLRPNTHAARSAGDRYRLTPAASGGVHFFAFNVDPGRVFADLRMRQAVQHALDRTVLAAREAGALPATRILSSGVLGHEEEPLYPVRGDPATARELAGGRRARVVVLTWVDPYTKALNDALRDQLAAIGLTVEFLPLVQGGSDEQWLANAERSDLIWGGLNANTADPAAYLKDLFLPPDDLRKLYRIQTQFSPEREAAAVSLARKIDRESFFAVYAAAAVPELVSRRLGCIVHPPQYAGVDLAALCRRD